MDREQADHQLWQHRPVHILVDADHFHGVQPYHPRDVTVEHTEEGWCIGGLYGMDTFRNDRFVILLEGVLHTVHRWEDIPEQIDNIIEFTPDPAHDLTFVYRFEKDGVPFTHSHWVHHDMDPWLERLRELIARETNGGWSARSDPHRRRRHPPLLRDGSPGRLHRHLLQWYRHLTSG